MLRHTHKGRTYKHNLQLASLLCGVAGLVNITGVLAFQTLTTNVTGHFAFFAEALFFHHNTQAVIYLFYICCFLSGAFFSSYLMEWRNRKNKPSSYVLPILIEISLLLLVAISGATVIMPMGFSCLLLFAMGLQNALVTRVSKSLVRTTHLTGLFTDLGIELSKICFKAEHGKHKQLQKSILLKLTIISCFFAGCIMGAFIYQHFELYTLLFPVIILFFVLWYDQLLFRYYHISRKIRHRHH